jgi:hypothetical protein
MGFSSSGNGAYEIRGLVDFWTSGLSDLHYGARTMPVDHFSSFGLSCRSVAILATVRSRRSSLNQVSGFSQPNYTTHQVSYSPFHLPYQYVFHIPYLISHNYLPCSVSRQGHHEEDCRNVSCMLGLESGFWSLAKQYYSIILPQDVSVGLQSSTPLLYFVEALVPWDCQDSIDAKLYFCACLVP